jgi:hypothetical protein
VAQTIGEKKKKKENLSLQEAQPAEEILKFG